MDIIADIKNRGMKMTSLERLKNGDVTVLDSYPFNNFDYLALMIRQRSDATEIVRGFIKKVRDTKPVFCFHIIYDQEEFKDDLQYLLDNCLDFAQIRSEELEAMLYQTSVGKPYIKRHLLELEKDEEKLRIVFGFIMRNLEQNMDLLKIFYLHQNLHVRFLFMKFIVNEQPEMLDIIYDDIMKYLFIQYDDGSIELMRDEDICDLAKAILLANLDKKIWLRLKEYILTAYPKNSLAYKLLFNGFHMEGKLLAKDLVTNRILEKEFTDDADRLFTSSRKGKLLIFDGYKDYLTEEIRQQFASFLRTFTRPDLSTFPGDDVYRIYKADLGCKLEEYVETYLDLSKNRTTGFIGSGTCAYCYRIGDYVLKLIMRKYIQDPMDLRSYLIIKTFEETYVRDESGIITAGLEVQPLLTKQISEVPSDAYSRLLASFKDEELLCQDVIPRNFMLLDSYLDADCDDPESLPKWFKQYPMVLVDKDLVFKLKK